ncbi:MAG: helix-turn-helix domain-containing protein [Holosporales bacterium]|jgi:DNA-binding protein Fis|nr:helix-turn-helix domain-containing protein [Holosporales bacterium]
MKQHNISSAIELLLDNFFLVQKNIRNVSGLYDIVIKEAETAVITKTMQLTDRNKKQTAKILGISRNTLDSKLKKLKIGIHNERQ